MEKLPLLSICIPTYNRANFLKITLNNITNNEIFRETNEVEIIISDNCSTDNTYDIIANYLLEYPNKIKYFHQRTNIKDKNFATVLGYANGTFAKLHNDTLLFNKDCLDTIVKLLKNNKDKSVIFFLNNTNSKDLLLEECCNIDIFFQKVSFNATWIGGLCIKTDLYKNIKNPYRFSKFNFSQIDIMARLLSINSSSLIISNSFMKTQEMNKKKGGYNIAEVFGHNLLTMLSELKKEGLISNKTIEKIKKDTLKNVINIYYFDINGYYTFTKSGYFKYLFKYYKFYLYFYKYYLKYQLLYFKKKCINTQRNYDKKVTILFGLIKIKQKINLEKKWRVCNKHNFTTLGSYHYDFKRIIVGKNSYGQIFTSLSSSTNEKLYIGSYCSIGSNVQFIVASEHNYKTLSTYPFKVMLGGEKFESLSKGDIIVKDDVWIGNNAIILSGITIEQGAVIAAGAVVTRNVEPYAIVAGNPARIIKYRFEPDIIEKLKQFDFSKLSTEKALEIIPQLYTNINKDNIDIILKKVEGYDKYEV